MTVDVFSLPVFPAAEVFPMMADDDLADLAADIKENGQREPIVLAEIPVFDEDGEPVDKELQLVDGRNRREACRIAEVEPLTRVHKFDAKPEPDWPKDKAKVKRLLAEAAVRKAVAFAVNSNNLRRHMTNDARIVAAAVAEREAGVALTKGSKGRGKMLVLTNILGLSGMTDKSARERMSLARLIAEWAPVDGRMVINGTKLFSEALAEARRKKREFEDAEKAEEERKEAEAKAEADKERIAAERKAALEALRLQYPDLAKQVDDGLALDDAQQEAASRERARAESKRSALKMIGGAIEALSAFRSKTLMESLRDYRRDDDFVDELAPHVKRLQELESGFAELLPFIKESSK